MEKMNVSIKKNDSFRVLSDSLKIPISVLEKVVLKGLMDEDLINGDNDDCGISISQLCNDQNISIPQIIELLFPGQINEEVPELLKQIFIWGEGYEHPCEQCGCEMDGEEDQIGNESWINWSCPNLNCDHSESNEPDWDTIPGGKDY